MSSLDKNNHFLNSYSADERASFYEGGKYTLANQDFSSASSAQFEQLASQDRDTMRSRARWLSANNPIISNIDETIINNSIGNGLRFQSVTGDKKVDDEIESLWKDWTEKESFDITGRYHFHDFQRILLGQRMTDGEILVQNVINKNKFFPLSLQAIEVDNLDKTYSPLNANNLDSNFVDGVELDRYGKPISYKFNTVYGKQFSVKAKNIINFYKPENRFSQYRGITEYKRTIMDLKNFAGFNDATIQSARVRANIGYVVENEGGISRTSTTQDDYELEQLNGVFVEYLRKGEKLHVIDPQSSGTGYSDFVNTTIRMIASARNVSYELAFKDFTKTNFSSARASLIQDHKNFSYNQEHMANYFLNPTFTLFVRTMMMAGNIRTINHNDFWKNQSKYIRPNWVVPERMFIDPLKEIKAIAEEVRLGVTTLSEVAKSKGKDFEELVTQRIKENTLLEKAGLVSEEVASQNKGK